MEAKFYIEAGQPKVLIDGEWNALSLFLESDSSFEEARKHVELKKCCQWMGNTSVLSLVSGNLFRVSTKLEIELNSVEIYQKQLLALIEEWAEFEREKAPHVVSV
ncbi:hypothetical protein [Hahella ganghwensis]|uniref:hypothetical protein n=1 Tax=Hahella ganghwensis TaxID=286420 RepID=UPI00036B1462|nr:hypothetical protein [Hahella ganghwensis]